MAELPGGWVEARLGEVATTQLGKMLSSKAKTGSGTRPYLRNKNVQLGYFDLTDVWEMDFSDGEFERFRIRSGDLLACEGGEVGRAAIWRGQIADVAFQKALHRIRPDAGIAPEFLMYVMRWMTQKGALDPFVTGSTIKHLPQEGLRLLPVPLPPLDEQRRIVAAIEERFSRLEAAEISLSAAARRAAALRASLFDLIAQSPWPLASLGDAATDFRYGTSVKSLPDGGGPAVLRIPNVRGGSIDISDLKYSTVGAESLGDCFVDDGDLLFVRTNGSRELIGRAAVTNVGQMAFASYLIRARPKRDRLNPRWAALALSSPTVRAAIETAAATTAGQYNQNLATIRSLRIPLPPLADQRRIVAEVEAQLSRIDAMRAAIDRAQRRSAALRRSILERAFRGELVPQDPSDEPAGVLLERIAAART